MSRPKRSTSQMPKLLVKVFGDPGEDICELEDAKYFLSFADRIIVVDGQDIRSYDELVKIVSQEKYKDQELIEVVQIPAIAGG
jgi:PDZ domain-containing secreted protein